MRHYNPNEPDIIRKDLTRGYTKENSLVVSQIIADLMGDDMGLVALGAFAARVVNGIATDDDDALVTLVCSKTGMTRRAIFSICEKIVAFVEKQLPKPTRESP